MAININKIENTIKYNMSDETSMNVLSEIIKKEFQKEPTIVVNLQSEILQGYTGGYRITIRLYISEHIIPIMDRLFNDDIIEDINWNNKDIEKLFTTITATITEEFKKSHINICFTESDDAYMTEEDDDDIIAYLHLAIGKIYEVIK